MGWRRRVPAAPRVNASKMQANYRFQGDMMHQRFTTVLTATLTALALSGCGNQQPSSAVPSAPGVESSTAVTSPSSTVTAAASPSSAQPSRIPTTGLPSAQFCDAGEKYLVKFPGLPRVQPPARATSESATSMCVYTAVTGDVTAATATLAGGELADDGDELPMFKRLCANDAELVPGGVTIAEEWVLARGWSGWTATKDGAQQAMLCTDHHRFSAALLNVPGSTPEDALNTIMSAID